MAGTLWDKFFWSDWSSDPRLRLCSYAARGLWIEMLAQMAVSEQRGYLVFAGKPLDAKAIARLTSGEESEVNLLLIELESLGVFSRDKGGKIYSRRMVRDTKKADTARENGALSGGNPNLRKKRGNPASVSQALTNGQADHPTEMPSDLQPNASTDQATEKPTYAPGACARGLPLAISHKPEPEARSQLSRAKESYDDDRTPVPREDAVESSSQANGSKPASIAEWQTSDDLKAMAVKLEAAAGDMLDRNDPGTYELRGILDLIAMGCDFERDVIPTIEDKVRKMSTPLRTWGSRMFRNWVLERRNKRLEDERVAAANVEKATGEKTEPGSVTTMDDMHRKWMVFLEKKGLGMWPRQIGPGPNEPGCPIKLEILVEYGWRTPDGQMATPEWAREKPPNPDLAWRRVHNAILRMCNTRRIPIAVPDDVEIVLSDWREAGRDPVKCQQAIADVLAETEISKLAQVNPLVDEVHRQPA